ncbi:hypothetical protein F5Y18DRAFT_195760 [Xylariaceae sp. FL1019]|nr:hypothetical protein F5Y18DRAFT_195760 [Xylariaceae sp. FL1019]
MSKEAVPITLHSRTRIEAMASPDFSKKDTQHYAGPRKFREFHNSTGANVSRNTGGIHVGGSARNVNTGILNSYVQNFFGIFVLDSGSGTLSSLPPIHAIPPDLTPQESSIRCLPLIEVSIVVEVHEDIARTTIKQQFLNPLTIPLADANYQLPLADGTALAAFECTIGTETTIIGQVKPRDEASKVFDEAREQDLFAAKVEDSPGEVIHIHLANIPARQTVDVELTYVALLHRNSNGDVIIAVPRSIAPTTSATHRDGAVVLSVRIKVSSVTPITKIQSESHPAVVYIGSLEVAEDIAGPRSSIMSNDFDPTRACVAYDDRMTDLRRDFVFVIRSAIGPQAIIETSPGTDGAQAIMITFSPRQLLSEVHNDTVPVQVIFVVDTYVLDDSTKVMCQDAISELLRHLGEESFINMNISIGSNTTLWSSSKTHTQLELLQTTWPNNTAEDVTDIFTVFQKAVDQRRAEETSHVVLITASQRQSRLDEILKIIETEMQKANGKLCFSALGIGDRVPGHVLHRFGELGGGKGELLRSSSKPNDMKKAILSILGAASSQRWKFEIVMDGTTQPSQGSFPLATTSPNSDDIDPVSTILGISKDLAYIQAPYQLDSFRTTEWRTIFLLYRKKRDPMPSFVTLKATAHSGETATRQISLSPSSLAPGTVNRLAAKWSVDDLESGRSLLHECLKSWNLKPHQSEGANSCIEHIGTQLGVQWSILSKWTSFVAVNRETSAIVATKTRNYLCSMSDAMARQEDLGKGWLEARDAPEEQLLAMEKRLKHIETFLRIINQRPQKRRGGMNGYGFGNSIRAESYPPPPPPPVVPPHWADSDGESGSSGTDTDSENGFHPENVAERQRRHLEVRVLEDAGENSASVVELSNATIEAFQFRVGGTVLVKAKGKRATALQVAQATSTEPYLNSAGLARIMCRNLNVRSRDTVKIRSCEEFPEVKKLVLEPTTRLRQAAKGVVEKLMQSYFRGPRPIYQGDIFAVDLDGNSIVFQVMLVEPLKYGMVVPNTPITLPPDNSPDQDSSGPEKISYRSIGGYREQLDEIREVLRANLQRSKLPASIGLRLPRCITVEGVKGCGKSLIGDAIMNQNEASFFRINCERPESKQDSKSSLELENTFKHALERLPSIVFIDDIDRLGDLGIQQLNESIKHIAGNQDIVVIASCTAFSYRSRLLDGFHNIQIGIHDAYDRLEVLRIHTRTMELDVDVDILVLAEETGGYSGRDIVALCSEAALDRAREILRAAAPDCHDALVTMRNFRVALKKLHEIKKRWPFG